MNEKQIAALEWLERFEMLNWSGWHAGGFHGNTVRALMSRKLIHWAFYRLSESHPAVMAVPDETICPFYLTEAGKLVLRIHRRELKAGGN